ncbi:unnamed protein product [Paramecium octaurelia]|uniref:Uncharacterized protein n=1 Tax=Paramecium octaurelia TaxID=43137 RepID=A0A8S1W881_PAROT|nr:unnamed protein product [Paramecium octaurelia]
MNQQQNQQQPPRLRFLGELQNNSQCENWEQGSGAKYGKWLFLIFQMIFYCVLVYSFAFGNPKELGQPFDVDNSPCGAGTGKEDYKFAYFVNPDSEEFLYRTLCLKECPKVEHKMAEADDSIVLDCHPNIEIASCDVRVQPDHPEFNVLYYDTIPFINVCAPTEKQRLQNVMKALQKPFIVRVLSDFYHSKLIFIGLALLALGLNFLIIYKIDDYPRLVIWIIVLIAILGFFGNSFLGLLYAKHLQQHGQIEAEHRLSEEEVIGYLHSNYVDSTTIFIISIIFIVVGFIAFIFTLIWRKSITTVGQKAEIMNNYYLISQPDENVNYLESLLKVFLGLTVMLAVFFMFILMSLFYLFTTCSPKSEEHQLAFESFQIDTIEIIFFTIIAIELVLVPFLVIGFSKLLIINIIIEIYKQQVLEVDADYLQNLNINLKQRNLQDCIGKTVRYHFGELMWGMFRLYFAFCSKPIFLSGFRSFISVCLTQQGFLQSAQNQLEYDQQLQNKNRKHYQGFDYQLIISVGVSNTCILVYMVLLLFSPACLAIHAPPNQILAIYLFTFMISYLFSTLYGMGMDTLKFLLYKDLNEQPNNNYIGASVQAQFRMIALPQISVPPQELEEFLNNQIDTFQGFQQNQN